MPRAKKPGEQPARSAPKGLSPLELDRIIDHVLDSLSDQWVTYDAALLKLKRPEREAERREHLRNHGASLERRRPHAKSLLKDAYERYLTLRARPTFGALLVELRASKLQLTSGSVVALSPELRSEIESAACRLGLEHLFAEDPSARLNVLEFLEEWLQVDEPARRREEPARILRQEIAQVFYALHPWRWRRLTHELVVVLGAVCADPEANPGAFKAGFGEGWIDGFLPYIPMNLGNSVRESNSSS